jgi:DNA-binding NarL/FixJ family response regulator
VARDALSCNNDMNHSFLLIDDHALFRAGLRMTLESAHPGVPLREAATLDEAVHDRRDAPAPTVVLLDLQLPGLNGMDGMTLIRHKWPDCAIVVLSADDSPDTARRALALGALRYISKGEPAASILDGIAAVMRAEPGALAPPATRAAAPRLTPRQCEVLDLLCQGMSNKLIGRRLNLSENTVRGHVQALLALLQVVSRAEAAYAARSRGLVG